MFPFNSDTFIYFNNSFRGVFPLVFIVSYLNKYFLLQYHLETFYIHLMFDISCYQELKAGIDSGQLLLDFLCQSGPQAKGADVQSLRSERSTFAETLGELRLQWLDVQRQLESQVSVPATTSLQNTTTYSLT